jgi:hypothetical protein
MSAFLDQLIVTLIDEDANDGRGDWELDDRFRFQSDEAGQIIEVEKGFHTDFASVPRLPVVFLLTGDTARKAAVIHDKLYKSKMLPRALADKVLLEACAVTGISAWRRWLIYAGVRVGGASHFGT